MSIDTANAAAAASLGPSRLKIAGAIKQAASSTGTSFEYLLATAKMESDFNPTAGASTSSAHGLYQFIDQTWLGTVKEAGPQLGYGQYADAISKSSDGGYQVSDPSARTAILKLRDDPIASSSMAAVLTQSNSFKLTGMIGRRPSDGELYMAHFMGVGGAAKLISTAEGNPQSTAAQLFPNAAAANPSIFYDHSGRARSVSEVYAVLSARYTGAANSPTTRTALAALGNVPPNMALASAAPTPALTIDNAAYLSAFPDAHAVTLAAASSPAGDQPSAPVFHSLFQGGERSQPVSATVHALWGKGSSLTSVASATPAQNPAASPAASSPGAPQPLDLFSDRSGTFSG